MQRIVFAVLAVSLALWLPLSAGEKKAPAKLKALLITGGGYHDYKKLNPVITENQAFLLSAGDTCATLQKAYAASNALYYRGQPAFEDILAEITKWAPKL